MHLRSVLMTKRREFRTMTASFVLLVVLIDGSNAVRRVLVTGANKGIGREICRRMLADVPDSYVILGSRNAQRGKDAVSTILKQEPSAEGRIEMVVLDVESDESVAAAVASIAARFSNEPAPLHGLCNNAGIGFGKNYTHNVQLLGPGGTDQILALGRPLLLGVSRKSYLGNLLGRQVADRLAGTLATLAVAISRRSAHILRVHDVAPTVDLVKVWRELDSV